LRNSTTVCAPNSPSSPLPSGSGKTTLAASWLRPADVVTQKSSLFRPDASSYAWLTLDPLDNAPARFLTGLAGALQTVDPRLGKLLLAMVQLPELPPISTLLGSVISDLGLWVARDYLPLTLVLDNYHHIESDFVQQALAFLLDNQPPQLHLVLLTNTEPPSLLAGQRAQGQVVELRENDLRFDTAEAAQFLNDNLHLNLPGSVVEALALGVSGWAAGLQLAALAIERHADPRALVAALPADRLETSGFLLDEYLQQQAPEMQRFLLLTSILPYLCADLCDAVWRAGNQKSSFYPAAFMLDHLGTSNPFLVPLDAAGRWLAYHDLFAGLLRQRLERTGIDTAVLHRSAGEWLQANNLWEEAVPHFLATRAWDRAGELLVKLADCLQRRGEALTLRR
jgi:LuxR family transcriptional regulator, maltose regulon positive regulatory protein